MPLPRPKFTNPATLDEYVWPVGHTEEGESGQRRQISSMANTANVGLVRQQGDLQPEVFQLTGTIFTRAHLNSMILWAFLCETQTINFTHPDGGVYEVSITTFTHKRQRAVFNFRAVSVADRYWTWKYTLEMDVIRVITNPS